MTSGSKQREPSSAAEPMPSPTRKLLFGPVTANDVPAAVVRRLRGAIVLGLLPEGERLPKEADLAAQMGITTFALREALSDLRQQGLLITRVGKNGGSFVVPGAGHDEVEKAELLSLSSGELRDLGDWRRMLAVQAAELAAARRSESSLGTLQDCVKRIENASSGADARRAHGRFHLELASAAQSTRLVRAEFAMHEQIDWLFGLALTDRRERRHSAAALADVVEAVRANDAPAARVAAARQIDGLVDRLAQLRLEAIAHKQPVGPSSRSGLDVELRTTINQLLDALRAIADDAGPALAGGVAAQEIRTRLSVAVLQQFGGLPTVVNGVGVSAEIGVIPEHPYWLQWWRRTGAGPVEDNHHDMDPTHEDFYDYESLEYISRPRRTHEPCAHGPYVDYGGVDEYIVTVSVPIVVAGRFYGVSLADILVADLESSLAPWLATSDEVVLLNADGRVLLSNVVRFSVGDMMSTQSGYRSIAFPQFGWTLLVRPASKLPSAALSA
jgi:DNA-binding FadR family transcriptional regulator